MPSTPSQQPHHLVHVALQLITTVRFSGLSLPPCRSAGGGRSTDHSGPKNKQGIWTRAIPSRCASAKISCSRSESAPIHRSGHILGFGMRPESLELGQLEFRQMVVGCQQPTTGYLSLPPGATKPQPAAAGKRTRTQPRSPWRGCTRT